MSRKDKADPATAAGLRVHEDPERCVPASVPANGLVTAEGGLLDTESRFGRHAPGVMRERLHRFMNAVYKGGWLGRRAFGRMRWVEKRLVGEISDVVRYGLRWRLYPWGNVSESRLLLRPDSFEPREVATVLGAVEPGFVFVDIGANCGFYSLRVAARGGRVVAVEPHPVMRGRLEYNVAVNDVARPSIHGCVVGDRVGAALMMEGARNLGSSRISEGGSLDVEMRPLMDIVAEERLEKIDAIKVDVEGFEDRVLGPFLEEAPGHLLPRLIVAEHSWKENWERDWMTTAGGRGYREVERTPNRNVILERS